MNQFVHSLPSSVFTDMHDAANEIDRLRVVERVYRRILSEGGVTSGVYEELYRLRAECEELRKDAERYRWLRTQKRAGRNGGNKMGRGIDVVLWGADGKYEGNVLAFDALDNAIDAAMRPSGETK